MAYAIFISYRHDDAPAQTTAIGAALKQQVGESLVCMDVGSIDDAQQRPTLERTALSTAKLVIVVIGRQWLQISDKYSKRCIDNDHDRVLNEIKTALNCQSRIIPVLVDGAKMPPLDVLPNDIKALASLQTFTVRPQHWHHDIKLLLSQLDTIQPECRLKTRQDVSCYPNKPVKAPMPIDGEKLEQILTHQLPQWQALATALPDNHEQTRIELNREYQFVSFQAAVYFMAQVAIGCDIAMHHPRWENIWRTVTVNLTTWDHGLQRVTDSDVMLAKYFDRAYQDYQV